MLPESDQKSFGINGNPIDQQEEEAEPIPTPIFLRDVQPIHEGAGQNLSNIKELSQFVEKPLLRACQAFLDKNIKTLMSSANVNDIRRGIVEIILDDESLSQENKGIFRTLIEEGKADIFFDTTREGGVNQYRLIIRVGENTTIQEIEDQSMEIADRFLAQGKPLNAYSLEEMREIYGNPKLTKEDILSTDWISYDEKNQLFKIN